MAQTKTRSLFAILLAGAALQALPAAAQGIDDRCWFEAAAYWPKVDTTIQLNSNTNNTIGTEIDFESDLNLDDGEALPALAAGARLGNRWRLTGEYYALGRSGEATLARDIVVEDVTYPVNAVITSEFDSDVYRFTVGYSFIRQENVEAGVALGLHATDFTVSLAGQGTVAGSPVAATQTRARDFLAPLPTIGVYGTWEVAPNVELAGNVDFLKLKVGDYDGRLLNAQLKLSYRVMRNVALGVIYRYVDYRVDVEKSAFTGRLTYEFKGPALFALVGF
jgi:hypothetical protein